MKKSSLFELFHPNGVIDSACQIGNQPISALVPELAGAPDGKFALVILAPSPDELSLPGWLRSATRLFASRLSRDGVGYLLVSPRWRLKTSWWLQSLGLRPGAGYGHLPDVSTSRFLVPLELHPTQYAFSALLPASPLKQRLGKMWFWLPWAGKILGYLWPRAGLVFRWPGAKPLFEWISNQNSTPNSSESVLLRPGWRGAQGATLLYQFSKSEACPAAVIKAVNAEGGESVLKEAQALIGLGPAARKARLQVPYLLAAHPEGERTWLSLSLVSGQPASELIRVQPGQFKAFLKQIAARLIAWNRNTLTIQPLTPDRIEREILHPATLLTPLLKHGGAYRLWLEGCAWQLVGKPWPYVAAHNDLTMENILITKDGEIGLVDWETGRAENWPFGDFFYTMTDAALTASPTSNRLDALRACFTAGGSYWPLARPLLDELVEEVKVVPLAVELCFQACWLHHATNELMVSADSTPRPFLEIVQWLARNYPIFPVGAGQ